MCSHHYLGREYFFNNMEYNKNVNLTVEKRIAVQRLFDEYPDMLRSSFKMMLMLFPNTLGKFKKEHDVTDKELEILFPAAKENWMKKRMVALKSSTLGNSNNF